MYQQMQEEISNDKHQLYTSYTEEAGFALVPIPKNSKGPRTKGWNLRENCIVSAEQASAHTGNIGLALAYSGVCTIDVDDYTAALEWFDKRGVDLIALLADEDNVQIRSPKQNRAKLLFKLPAGQPLPTYKFDGIVEFRCASKDLRTTVQDLIPPSIHPECNEPYKWFGDYTNIPVLPDALHKLWQSFDKPIDKPIASGSSDGSFSMTEVSEGSRNDSLFKQAARLVNTHSKEAALIELHAYNNENCNPPLDTNELETILNSAYGRYKKSEPFSMSQFSLNGKSKEFESQMLNDVYVLGRIAILGQATALYAKYNFGKTLLAIWLVVQTIKAGEINAEDIFYINADDNHKGMTQKLKIAEKYGFQMLTPGYNDFEAERLCDYMEQLVTSSEAKGKVIILDTLKKFTNLMCKKEQGKFNKAMRKFTMGGGTIIALAHVTKYRNEDGKLVPEGTDDVPSDWDCAYVLDVTKECQDTGIRYVTFENIKNRGDVDLKSSYMYSYVTNISYYERLNSVEYVADEKIQEIEQKNNYKADLKAIDAIQAVLKEGIISKNDLLAEAYEMANTPGDEGSISHSFLKRVLGEYLNDFWKFDYGDNNAHMYSLVNTYE